jgi:type I restriction enzyme S subunit
MKDGWEYKKLGDLCQVLDSQRKPVTKKDRTKGIYPYYGATGIQDYVDSYIFDGRFLLVGEDGAKWGASDKTAYIIEGKSWVNNHAHILKVLENVNDRLLEYYLTFKDLSEYITGAVVPKLTQKALVSIPIPIPPLSEQQHIVEELDLLSSIIEKKKAQLNELDNLAQSLFYEMFNEEFAIKQNWRKCHVGDVYKFQYGKGNKIPEDKGNYLCYGSNGVVGHHTTFNSEDAPIIGHIGAYAGIVNWGIGKHYVTYNGVICKLKEDCNNPIYGYYMLKSQDYLNIAKRGGAQPFVSYDLLEEPTIYVPPLDLQNQFASKIDIIDKQKELLKQSIKEVEALFNSRMDYYFN